MLSNIDLLDMYKAEKADMNDVVVNDFPSFKEWKAEFITEYDNTHHTVGVEEAVQESDKIVDSALKELDNRPEVNPKQKKETTMTTATATPSATSVAAPSKPRKTKATKAAKATSVKKPASKMHQAEVMFKQMISRKTKAIPGRGKVIAKFQERLGMSSAGASTYYYNIKAKLAANAGK